jgi:hypothetical protein
MPSSLRRRALSVALAVAGVVTGVSSPAAAARGPAGSAPVVTSAEYPNGVDSGAPGMPGTFHFAAPIPQVVEYRYRFNQGQEVTVPDGTATVTPPGPGRYTLRVRAVGATGRITAETVHTVAVNPVPPLVEGAPATPVARDTQFELVFTAQQPGAVEFVYQHTGGAEQIVPVVNGKATVTITAFDPYVSVQSRTAEGYRSAPRRLDYQVIRS